MDVAAFFGSGAGAVQGLAVGTVVGDMAGAVPLESAAPAISSAAKTKTTANGQIVNNKQTPRQILSIAATYVVIAIVILLFGSRLLKDARI